MLIFIYMITIYFFYQFNNSFSHQMAIHNKYSIILSTKLKVRERNGTKKRAEKKYFITIVTNWQSGCGFFSLLKREATKKFFNEKYESEH